MDRPTFARLPASISFRRIFRLPSDVNQAFLFALMVRIGMVLIALVHAIPINMARTGKGIKD